MSVFAPVEPTMTSLKPVPVTFSTFAVVSPAAAPVFVDSMLQEPGFRLRPMPDPAHE